MDRTLHPSVAERLARLAPDQRSAATAPPGPCCALPRPGAARRRRWWRASPGSWTAGRTRRPSLSVAFNKRAAEELAERLDAALAPLGVAAGAVRVRTFHALGREILRDAGVAVEPLVDRDELLRELFPEATVADRGRLDLAFSRLKLDIRVTRRGRGGRPGAGAGGAGVHRLRAGGAGERRGRLRRPRGPGAAAAGGRRRGPRALAGALRPAARGRGTGPGPHAARDRAAPGGAREPGLPRR